MNSSGDQSGDGPKPDEAARQEPPGAGPSNAGNPESRLFQRHEQHFQRFLWVHYTVILLGFWLLTSPFTFGYNSIAFILSDLISGALLVVFGLLSLSPRRLWAPWGAFATGAWLNLAPIIMWAPEASIFVNNTAVGVVVVALTILIPDVPGSTLFRKPGPEIPPGWTYNPSSWLQRMPLVALAAAGWFMSRYLAAYQLGYIDWAWDPIFGDGTVRVLESDVSKAFPVSDAGLGTVAYTFEMLLAFMGVKDRWRTNPSTVLVFGLLVVPLGVTHLALVTMMPVLVGYWCALCLLTAALMLIMVPLAVGEIVATLQFIGVKRREGHSFWALVVKGEGLPGDEKDTRSPQPNAPLRQALPAMVWGVTLPWTLVVCSAIGIWLMVAPAVLGTGGAAANSNFLTGAVVITIAVVAMGEVARVCRFLNIPVGIWIVVSPWFLTGGAGAGTINGLIAGIVLIALSIPRGSIRERYGSWDRFIL